MEAKNSENYFIDVFGWLRSNFIDVYIVHFSKVFELMMFLTLPWFTSVLLLQVKICKNKFRLSLQSFVKVIFLTLLLQHTVEAA